MDSRVLSLFNIFPRDIGIPNPIRKKDFYRREVSSFKEFYRYITLMTGSNRGAYASVYDNNTEITLDKVVFDLDNKTNLNKALEDTISLINRLQDRDIPYAVTFSGRKGFHVYGLLKPAKLSRDIGAYYLKSLQEELAEGIESVDRQLIGDIRRMIRIPNSLNNGYYCSPLPTNFQKMSIEEILDYSKNIHKLSFSYGKLKPIQELVGNIRPPEKPDKNNEDEILQDNVGSIPDMDILAEIVRPYVLEAVRKPNPPHIVRLDFVSELMFLGLTEQEIFEIIKRLNWEDFDEGATKYQIKYVFEKKLKPYSGSKLCQVLGCDNIEKGYYWWSGR